MKLKKRFNDLVCALKEVFKKPGYIILSILIALMLIIFNIGMINYNFFLNAPSLKAAILVFFGTFVSRPLYSLILIVVIALLTGIFVSLLTYHIKKLKQMSSATGVGGIVVGIIAPACPSCGIGFLTILGVGGGLSAALPLRGTELSILAVILLTLATFSISTKITDKTCKTKKSFFSRIFKRSS